MVQTQSKQQLQANSVGNWDYFCLSSNSAQGCTLIIRVIFSKLSSTSHKMIWWPILTMPFKRRVLRRVVPSLEYHNPPTPIVLSCVNPYSREHSLWEFPRTVRWHYHEYIFLKTKSNRDTLFAHRKFAELRNMVRTISISPDFAANIIAVSCVWIVEWLAHQTIFFLKNLRATSSDQPKMKEVATQSYLRDPLMRRCAERIARGLRRRSHQLPLEAIVSLSQYSPID